MTHSFKQPFKDAPTNQKMILSSVFSFSVGDAMHTVQGDRDRYHTIVLTAKDSISFIFFWYPCCDWEWEIEKPMNSEVYPLSFCCHLQRDSFHLKLSISNKSLILLWFLFTLADTHTQEFYTFNHTRK